MSPKATMKPPTLPPGLEAAIEAGVADGSIFNDNDDVPQGLADLVAAHPSQTTIAQDAFDRLAPTLRKDVKVMWRCSCGEMWAGPDMERDVHRHGAYEGGTHRVNGPLFPDTDTEQIIRAAWAKEDQ